MIRIFATLAFLSIILLLAAMMMGLTMGDLYEKPMPGQDTLQWATIHRLTGVAAALAVVFVESVVVTYFIGTSRWVREVVETYRFDPAPIVASNRLKRRTFPWALAGMLTVVGIISLGGAADPATMRPNTKPGPIGTSTARSWESLSSLGRILLSGTTSSPITRSLRASSQMSESSPDQGLEDGLPGERPVAHKPVWTSNKFWLVAAGRIEYAG